MAPDGVFQLRDAVPRDPRIDAWFDDITDPLRLMVRAWFERMRGCGSDVRELLHDGCPVACVGTAAFGYVNAFRSHASVGFFHGAWLPDPAHILRGNGKRMRHVKLGLKHDVDDEALEALIRAAYADLRKRTVPIGPDASNELGPQTQARDAAPSP